MLVPVSPSGTGKTLRRLTSSWLAESHVRLPSNARLKSGPSTPVTLRAATTQQRSSRTPWTLTLTFTTGTLTERSTSNFTVSCRLCATSEIRIPYWTITYTSIASPSSSWTTSTPLSTFSRLSSSAKPSRRPRPARSEEHTSELQSPCNLVC